MTEDYKTPEEIREYVRDDKNWANEVAKIKRFLFEAPPLNKKKFYEQVANEKDPIIAEIAGFGSILSYATAGINTWALMCQFRLEYLEEKKRKQKEYN